MRVVCFFFFFLSSAGPAWGKKKTFIYCSEASPTIFNPSIATDGPSHFASANTVYNQLLTYTYGTTKIIPSLAVSWTISPDQKVYTFKLRRGVKFHSTPYFTPKRDFNADDVLFSFNRQRNKNHPYHQVGGGNYPYLTGMGFDKLLQEIKKIDDYTVQFILKHPESPFLDMLADGPMSIFSAEYGQHLTAKGQKERIDNYPIGTGAFVFKKYVKDTVIRYEVHPNFWGEKAKIDRLIFSITPDASVRYQKLKTGECHLIVNPFYTDLVAMEKNLSLKVAYGPGFNVGYLAINVLKKPLDNPLVRRAIYHALDRQSYIKAIYLGHAVVAKGPIPPSSWGHSEKVKDYAYDPARAKELLQQAGLAKGFSTEIWTLPVARPYNPNGKKMGEMMQADLAKVGIKAKLVTYDWPTYLKKSTTKETSMVQIGWSAGSGEPDRFLSTLLSCRGIPGLNISHWCHPPFDKIVTKAKSTTDQKKRIAIYLQAQKIFKEQLPWIPIAHSTVFVGMRREVMGFKIDPRGDIFQFVSLEE